MKYELYMLKPKGMKDMSEGTAAKFELYFLSHYNNHI